MYSALSYFNKTQSLEKTTTHPYSQQPTALQVKQSLYPVYTNKHETNLEHTSWRVF